MKKLFALFLALSLLFLTACNTTPPVGTNTDGSTTSETRTDDSTETPNSGNTSNGGDSYHWDWSETLQDQIVTKPSNRMIELPSRIVFTDSSDGYQRVFYYSKADGNGYVYCFDPLCDHTDYTCLANPENRRTISWDISSTFFINNRFYSVTGNGQIWSFAFDGSDKKVECGSGYGTSNTNLWSGMLAYGPYIYIQSKALEERHTLRFNVETKKLEDLTEKTGNYITPYYAYNGMIYGFGTYETVDAFFKADLDLNTIEPLEDSNRLKLYTGSLIIGNEYKERESISQPTEKIGLLFYDIATGERKVLTKEDLGLSYFPTMIAATDEYIYFYKSQLMNLGTDQAGHTVQKFNDGKLYRMNLDGTNIVCVYEHPDYELSSNMIIFDNHILMQGRYIRYENGEKKVWGGMVQVATINPDGTIGEFVEVEVLQ